MTHEAGVGDCFVCCALMICCGECFPCILCKVGGDVAGKYGVDEGCATRCFKSCCCGCCYYFQIVNQVMVKENLHYGCTQLEKDGGSPQVEEMER